MRWLVEVTSIGKSDTQSYCVESDSWQKALQGVKTERGGSGTLSSFSIELLEDGYRAVDPLARLRFTVKRAPDDMAADIVAPPSSKHAAVTVPDTREVAARAAASSAAPTLPSNGATAPPPAKDPDPGEPRKGAQTLTFGSATPATVPPAGAKKDRPSTRPPPGGALGRASERPSRPSERPTKRSDRPPATRRSERPPGARRSERPPAAPVAEAVPPAGVEIPRPAPTPANMPSAKPGASAPPAAKPLVEAKKPDAPSKSEPAPRTKPEAAVAKSQPPPAPNAGAAVAKSQPAPAPKTDAPAPKDATIAPVGAPMPGFPVVKVASSREEDPTEQTPLLYREYALVAPVGTTESDAERLLRAELDRLKLAVAGAKSRKLANLAVFDADFVGKPKEAPICALTWKDWKDEIVVTFPRRTRQSMNVKSAAVGTGTLPSATAPSERRTPVPGGTTEAEQRLAAAASVEVRRPSNRPPSARAKDRMTGDELLSSLFEAMHDLHFMRDSLDGGDFCLRLAHENFPCEHGVIHGFDMMKREFVTMCATKSARALLSRRYPEDDPLIEAALRARKSIVIADASNGHAGRVERFKTLGGARSVIVTPVMWGGRALGAIELVNPLDGTPFRDDEGNAMSYIAEQFAEFIGSHGLVVDPQKILSRAR